MQFPSLRAYMASISDLNNSNIPFFKSKSMQIYLNRRGVPYMSVGGFGAVFRFKDKKNHQFALKCFTSHVSGRAERYQALHDTLQITKFPFMVDFQYVQNGIQVGNKSFPVVVMQWGQGIPFNTAIANDLKDDGKLQSAARLAGNLLKVVKTLQEWNMAHGDLQEGNILIGDDDKVTLIDYDGMFIPALEGKKSTEIGLANYQHPKRTNKHFSSTLDDFALLTILYQLSLITPNNWKLHDDKRLILSQKDHQNADKSALIQEGLKSKEPHVKALAELLKEACKKDPLNINALQKIESRPEIMKWLKFSAVAPINTNYTSIISEVVSLTEAEVLSFEQNKIKVGTKDDNKPESKQPNRSLNAGNWGLSGTIKQSVIDLFFEDEEERIEATRSSDRQSTSFFSKMKENLVDLLYEPEDNLPVISQRQTQTPLIKPGKAKGTTIQKTTKNAKKEKTKKTTKKAATKKAEKKKPAKKTNDGKTAPKPDWMKKRKRKK